MVLFSSVRTMLDEARIMLRGGEGGGRSGFCKQLSDMLDVFGMLQQSS